MTRQRKTGWVGKQVSGMKRRKLDWILLSIGEDKQSRIDDDLPVLVNLRNLPRQRRQLGEIQNGEITYLENACMKESFFSMRW